MRHHNEWISDLWEPNLPDDRNVTVTVGALRELIAEIQADAIAHCQNQGHSDKELLHRILAALETQEHKLKEIIMTQAELAAGLKTIQTQVGKVAKEQSDRFDALSKEIADLKDVITAGGDVTPEVTAALADVQTALQSLDDTIPDAPATPA